MKTYIIELNEVQARTVADACELYMRIRLGQVHTCLDEHAPVDKFKPGYHDTLRAATAQLAEFLPECVNGYNSSFGIAAKELPEVARTACDIYEVIRQRLALDRLKEGEKPGHQVHFNEPMRWGKEPLITIHDPQSRKMSKPIIDNFGVTDLSEADREAFGKINNLIRESGNQLFGNKMDLERLLEAEVHQYEVICGNIGCVSRSEKLNEAKKIYNVYVAFSKANFGRAAGEQVTLIEDGETLQEYFPPEKPEKKQRRTISFDVRFAVELPEGVDPEDIDDVTCGIPLEKLELFNAGELIKGAIFTEYETQELHETND